MRKEKQKYIQEIIDNINDHPDNWETDNEKIWSKNQNIVIDAYSFPRIKKPYIWLYNSQKKKIYRAITVWKTKTHKP